MVFVGTFTSGGLDAQINDGKLSIEREGKYRKFVDTVGQVTFSGKRAGREGRSVLYVTERCVFGLSEDGLELLEVAPGIDIKKDILDLLPFNPIVCEPKTMASELFFPELMGLRDRMSDIGIEDRITYTPQTNTLFLNFAGMRINSVDEVDRVKTTVENILKPLNRRVVSIVNYDSFWVDPEIADHYLDAVRYIEDNYYLKVSRYTTNGFLRIKLSRGLEERRVTSNVMQNYVEATASLDEE